MLVALPRSFCHDSSKTLLLLPQTYSSLPWLHVDNGGDTADFHSQRHQFTNLLIVEALPPMLGLPAQIWEGPSLCGGVGNAAFRLAPPQRNGQLALKKHLPLWALSPLVLCCTGMFVCMLYWCKILYSNTKPPLWSCAVQRENLLLFCHFIFCYPMFSLVYFL